jgi:ankyrin repeat protein
VWSCIKEEKKKRYSASVNSSLPPSSLHINQQGHVKVARLLMKAGANPNRPAKDGATALIAAASSGHKKVCAMVNRETFLHLLYIPHNCSYTPPPSLLSFSYMCKTKRLSKLC